MLMIKILLTVCLVWTFVSGCERQGLEKHCSGPAVVPLSAEAQMVKKGVEDLKNGMFRKGYDQMEASNRLVLKLNQLAVHERPQIAHVFAELIEALEPVGGDKHAQTRDMVVQLSTAFKIDTSLRDLSRRS